jgi:hypothetical protein
MADLTLTCPLDGLRLGGVRDALTVDGDVVRHADRHFHIRVQRRATCANGHEWVIDGNLTIYRVRAGGETDMGRV